LQLAPHIAARKSKKPLETPDVIKSLRSLSEDLRMLHPIIEEIWTTGGHPKLIRRLGVRAVEDGWEPAYDRAKLLAAAFAEQHGFIHDEQYSFGWAREKNSDLTHRFIVA
jgi:hypothetical protein